MGQITSKSDAESPRAVLSRRAFLRCAGLAAAGLALPCAGAQAGRASTRPNILFLLTDDQGPWTLGRDPRRHPNAHTPNLDRLAQQGALLTNAFATAAVCSPARASLVTGRYASETGLWPDGEVDYIRLDGPQGLRAATPTWPRALAETGYKTALVGKWHVGHMRPEFHPTQQGYTTFTGFPHGGESGRSRDPIIEVDGVPQVFEGEYTPDVLTNFAMEQIRQWRGEPFAISLHFWAPHANTEFPEGYELPYEDRSWLPVREEDMLPWREGGITAPEPNFPNLDQPRLDRMTREYLASVHSVDRNVGRLLDLLEELGLAENTLVVFTSDHGYNMGHNGIWHKGNGRWITRDRRDPAGVYDGEARDNLYDNSLRVPGIVRWPARIAPGTVVDRTISFLDWTPTLLAAAGAAAPEGARFRGANVLPLLQGRQEDTWDDTLFAEYLRMRCIRTPEWKFVRDFGTTGVDELYDLRQDPAEQRNLLLDPAEASAHATVRQELEQKLLAHMESIGDPLR